MSKVEDLDYWKENCADDYLITPISVLRYITELENKVEEAINYTHSCTELKEFKDEFIEAWEDGSGGDSDLYRKAKNL